MMRNELTIRPMTVDDLPSVAALETRCFPDPWSPGIFQATLADENGYWICAWSGDTLLGYGGMQTVLDEGSIDNLAVMPEMRRQGVGAALLDGLIGYGAERGLRFLTLEVRAGNDSAIRLYESRGFIRLGIRRGYYLQPREDALIMTRYYIKEDTVC